MQKQGLKTNTPTSDQKEGPKGAKRVFGSPKGTAQECETALESLKGFQRGYPWEEMKKEPNGSNG